jgi:uncharacterized membrane protein
LSLRQYNHFCLVSHIFFCPFILSIIYLKDPGLKTNKMPEIAYYLHRQLSDRYEKWATKRVKSGLAEKLSTEQIAATEWPVFGSVFYLWATEALQQAFDKDPTLASASPKDYAKGAIEAAAALIADSNHATWVRLHWGDDYLEKENLFYRMLLISGLTSYQKLSDFNNKYEPLLRNQVESLAKELDESPYGLLDDYPGQCYPVDILPAIAAIRRADTVLGTDHSKFAARAVRGFQETRLDNETGLPAYFVSSKTGKALDSARGVGLSFMLIWAPELWPETALDWYEKYENQFWQEGKLFSGFREYSKDINPGWFVFNDIDAGPVISGYGIAASAFGIGAARAMGRFDHARPLAAQALVCSWPLPNSTLLTPRILSNMSDAPYLGEAALLFALTRMPVGDVEIKQANDLPRLVYIVPCIFLTAGFLQLLSAALSHRRRAGQIYTKHYPYKRIQLIIWAALVVSGIIILVIHLSVIGILFILLAQFLPKGLAKQPEND